MPQLPALSVVVNKPCYNHLIYSVWLRCGTHETIVKNEWKNVLVLYECNLWFVIKIFNDSINHRLKKCISNNLNGSEGDMLWKSVEWLKIHMEVLRLFQKL